MKDTIATAIATILVTSIRIGIGYAGAWLADDSDSNKKETAEDDAEK